MVLRAGQRPDERIFDGYTSPTIDAPHRIEVLFTEVPDETANTPKELAISGKYLGLAPTTDAPGELLVAIEEPSGFMRMAAGTELTAGAKPFTRIWVKRPSTVPAIATRKWVIEASHDRPFQYGPTAQRVLSAGAAQLAGAPVTINGYPAQSLIVTNDNRRTLWIRNESINDVFLHLAADASNATAFWKLGPGEAMTQLNFTGAVFAAATAAGSVVRRFETQ